MGTGMRASSLHFMYKNMICEGHNTQDIVDLWVMGIYGDLFHRFHL